MVFRKCSTEEISNEAKRGGELGIDGFKNILTGQKVCSLLVRRIKGDKTQRIMNNSSCFILCAASRSAEPAGEFEPSPGPAALGEGQRESRIHPG